MLINEKTERSLNAKYKLGAQRITAQLYKTALRSNDFKGLPIDVCVDPPNICMLELALLFSEYLCCRDDYDNEFIEKKMTMKYVMQRTMQPLIDRKTMLNYFMLKYYSLPIATRFKCASSGSFSASRVTTSRFIATKKQMQYSMRIVAYPIHRGRSNCFISEYYVSRQNRLSSQYTLVSS